MQISTRNDNAFADINKNQMPIFCRYNKIKCQFLYRYYKTNYLFHLQVLQKPSVEARQHLTVLSRNVATSVAEIVHSAEAIKGRVCLSEYERFATDSWYKHKD